MDHLTSDSRGVHRRLDAALAEGAWLVSAELPDEIAAARTPWMQLVWTGAMWIATAWCASFIDDRVVQAWAFAVSSVLVVLTLGWLYATQRLVDIQRQLIDAYRDEMDIADELIETLKQEAHTAKCAANSYRRAFVYAKKVGEGMDPKQAGIVAGREAREQP
jgi:hypothetical protein